MTGDTDAGWGWQEGYGYCPMGGYWIILPPTPTPPHSATYTANGSVMGSATALGQSLVSGYMGIIPTALLIVGGLIVTLFLVRKLIGWVRKNIHG
jgi:hypothetical protein